MFTVKATYNSETRKFTFKQSILPTYSQICNELHRVFPITDYYFSDLLFCSPEPRVFTVSEVRNEADYKYYIRPFFERDWHGGVLKFVILDELTHKAPSAQHSGFHATSDHEIGAQSHRTNSPLVKDASRLQDQLTAPSISRAASGANRFSMCSESSCCSVAEGKRDMKDLMDNFLRDVKRTMSETFGEDAILDEQPVSPPPVVANVGASSSKELGAGRDNSSDALSALPIPGSFRCTRAPTQERSSRTLTTVWCDSCGRGIYGTRLKCLVCDDFDLCESCMLNHDADVKHSELFEPRHVFATLNVPSNQKKAPENTHDVPCSNAPPVVHPNIICDICDSNVVGNRHKCLDCPDYDLCDACYPQATDLHYAHHQFFTIESPGSPLIHTFFTGRDEVLRLPQPQSQQQQSANAGRPPSAPVPVVHGAVCDLCDSAIIGDRYKCLVCPDYDVCYSCHSIVPEQHPFHVFVKLSQHQDLSSTDPARYNRHAAVCDGCNEAIFGIRYKCMHPSCADYDLCAKCEALPIRIHPSTHPMLKMRDPSTVIPTVYRVGHTTVIPQPQPQPQPQQVPAMQVEVPAVSAQQAPAAPSPPAILTTTSAPDPNELPATPLASAPLESSHRAEQDPFSDAQEAFDKAPDVQEPIFAPVSFPSLLPQLLKDPSIQSRASAEELRARFVSNNNIEDGQLFPAGAEFVKSWRMENDGSLPWPNTTEIIFVAGDRLPAMDGAPTRYHVGRVEPGAFVDVNAGDMKAPEVPGKYVGYWKLSDESGKTFGQSMWCEIIVPEIERAEANLPESLSSSAMIMPASAPVRSNTGSTTEAIVNASSPVATPNVAPTLTSDMSSELGTETDSSISLLDDFETASDAAEWEASRVHNAQSFTGDMEYVVLYDEENIDED